MSAERWRVKWDETEIPDGEYVRASDYDAMVAKGAETILAAGREVVVAKLRIRELEAALSKYGDHLADCRYLAGDYNDAPIACDCGLAAAIAGSPLSDATPDREGEPK